MALSLTFGIITWLKDNLSQTSWCCHLVGWQNIDVVIWVDDNISVIVSLDDKVSIEYDNICFS
jgi:hypothetical protein